MAAASSDLEPSDNTVTICKKCGWAEFRKKGKRTNEGYEVQKYQCKKCGKWTSDNSRKQWTEEEEGSFADAYYHSVVTIEKLPENVTVVTLAELGKIQGLSKAALTRRIRKIVASMEDGLETTRKKLNRLGHFLVVDSKHTRIKGKICYCWLAVDATTEEPIHFALSTSKDKRVIRRFLSELRFIAGYKAEVVTADMEESILEEGEAIFTHEASQAKPLLQACTVHRLRQIARKWPSLEWKGKPELGKRKKNAKIHNDPEWEQKKNSKKRKGRPLSPLKVRARIEFSELACKLLYADTIEQKNAVQKEMRARERGWSIDKVIMKEYNSLMSNVNFYHTKEELHFAPFDNNKAETLNGVLKKKLSRMQGFKTLETGRLHLKGFWQTYRRRKFPDTDTSVSLTDSKQAVLPTIVLSDFKKTELSHCLPALPPRQPLLALPSPSAKALAIIPAPQPTLATALKKELEETASAKPSETMCIGTQYLDRFADPKVGMPAIIKRTHYEILHVIRQANSTKDLADAKESIKKILRRSVDNLQLGQVPIDELAITATVTRSLSSYSMIGVRMGFDGEPVYEYKNLPAHMRAAKILMEVKKSEVKLGDVIAYVRTTGSGGVIPLELAKTGEVDTYRYIEMIESAFRQILSAFSIGFKHDIVGIPKQQSLSELFWS
jgi:hypothetical protein